jgi:hypothetical protein
MADEQKTNPNPNPQNQPQPQPQRQAEQQPADARPRAQSNLGHAIVDGLDDMVERWWNEHIVGSAVGRHTDAWNHMQGAKEHLKDMLRSAGANR